MLRKIIKIDEEKCNGCGACAAACHEGAIDIIDGKAKLMREHYCDGLGDCLPACPTDAITFEEREAPAYDEAAVLQAKLKKAMGAHTAPAGGCPGARPQSIARNSENQPAAAVESQLSQWPVQLKLVPIRAPFFDGADLLIAADCTAYAYGSFHNDFIRDHAVVIGCPKLDATDYAEKLSQIFAQNDIRSVTIVRMQVPCCGGIVNMAQRALAACGKDIPCRVVILSVDGKVLG